MFIMRSKMMMMMTTMTGSPSVDQVGLEFTETHLALPPENWDQRSPYLA